MFRRYVIQIPQLAPEWQYREFVDGFDSFGLLEAEYPETRELIVVFHNQEEYLEFASQLPASVVIKMQPGIEDL